MINKIKLLFSLAGKQIILVFKNLLPELKILPVNKKEFGWKVAIIKYIDSLLLFNKRRRYISTITDYMNNELSGIYVPSEKDMPFDCVNPAIKPDSCIWMCWWQGECNMPDVVKACTNHTKSVSKSLQVVIITKDNYRNYVKIPDDIVAKFEQGKICIAHFSDMIRMQLLFLYGGLWIDATCFISDKSIISRALQCDFFSIRLSSKRIISHESSRGKWCTFFLGGKKGFRFFLCSYAALEYYWRNHDIAIDYTLLDYSMYIGYINNQNYQVIIDRENEVCNDVWNLLVHMNDPYVECQYNTLINDEKVYKLSHREKLLLKSPDGLQTNYSHFLEDNL